MWQFISTIPGIRLLEGDSQPNKLLRKFERFPEVEWRDAHNYCSVVAWPSNISSVPAERQIVFNGEGRRWSGGKGRTSLSSPAFLRIAQIDAPNPNLIGFNELIFESLASASRRFSEEQLAGVEWPAMGMLIRGIKTRILNSAAAKWRSIPVSPGIAAILRSEGKQLWFWGHEGTI